MPYSFDTNSEHTPLSAEEVGWLIDNMPRSFIKNKEAIEVFLKRALLTALQLRQVRLDFDSEIRRRSSIMPTTGGAMVAANPEYAARFLSPEQLKSLFDAFSRERLEALEEARTAAIRRENVANRSLILAKRVVNGSASKSELEEFYKLTEGIDER
ncbi:MAG: hypothetical protein ACKOW9_00260 [Candidatus Paceibacterota bacterium]